MRKMSSLELIQPVSRKELDQLIVTLYNYLSIPVYTISWCECFSRNGLYLNLEFENWETETGRHTNKCIFLVFEPLREDTHKKSGCLVVGPLRSPLHQWLSGYTTKKIFFLCVSSLRNLLVVKQTQSLRRLRNCAYRLYRAL